MSALKRRADYEVSLVRRLLGHASQPAERTSFFIGYYQTQRAKRFRVENIHTDQSCFLSTALFDLGYRVFLHFKSGVVTEVKLGDNPPPVGRIDSPKNLEGLLLSGCLGKLTE